jgi:YHS domain-containing protein
MTDGAGTFVFADLAGFTALTEAHGDEEAVKLVEEFPEAVEAELPAVRGGGRQTLRNVAEPIEIFAALRVGQGDRLPVDPVCRMVVDPNRAAGQLVYEESAYFFCSLTCAGEFARHPERFT